MINRTSSSLALLGSVILITGLAILLFLHQRWREGHSTQKTENSQMSSKAPGIGANTPSALPTASISPSSPTLPATSQQAKLRDGLKAMFAKLSPAGVEEPPPIAYLERAVATGNKIEMDRAFDHTVYLERMREVIPALRSQLKNNNPYVQYLAAQHLLVVGDDSGVPAMIALVQAKSPISGVGEETDLHGTKDDLRNDAAHILAQYRQTSAVDAISALYLAAPNPRTSLALSDLGAPQPDRNHLVFVSSEMALTQYAKSKDTQFIPQTTALFHHADKPLLKAAAAWSLATLTGDPAAADYLIEQAHDELDRAKRQNFLYNGQMLKYVGTLQTPAAKQTLELALESSGSHLVEIAIVNLLYNQGGSDKALHKLAEKLEDTTNTTLSADFVNQLATKFGDSKIIQDAAKVYRAHGGEEDWQRFVVERKNWSMYNWINDYVVQLNH